MANQLKMAMVQAIIGLLEQGWSYRRIARELGIHREAVARHDRLRKSSNSKPANATPGSMVPDRFLGPPSFCQPFAEIIKRKLESALSRQRIWQDLVSDYSFSGSYSSVKRYLRRLGNTKSI